MIKAQDIIAQLQTAMPTLTGLFSNADISITSLTCSGTTVTAKTSVQHKLKTGNAATIMGAQTPIDITSITYVNQATGGAIVTVKTANDHDFTEGWGYQATITGTNAPAFEGTFDVLTTINRKTFTYFIPTQQAYAVINGTLMNSYTIGYNGRFVVTVIDEFTFTYTIGGNVASPAGGSIVLRTGARISGAVSFDRANDAYTKQATGNMWAFVVLSDNSVSKDRNVTTDATITLAPGDDYRIRVISNFSIFIFAPATQGDVGGRAVRDSMEDVRVALYKSILRYIIPSYTAEQRNYVVAPDGDRTIGFNEGAYLVYEFLFSVVSDVVYADTVAAAPSRAFRDINLIFENPLTGSTIMETDNISLDDDHTNP